MCRVHQTDRQVSGGGGYLARQQDRRDGFGSARGRGYRAQLPVQEDFFGTGVTPNPQRGQIHGQVVLRLLDKPEGFRQTWILRQVVKIKKKKTLFLVLG